METKDFGKPQDVGSDCMSQQKFRFPFQPYGVQTQFMNTLFDILTKGNIGIIESPTGTGKTLSLLCGSLAWLNSVSTLPEDYVRDGSKDNKETQTSLADFPAWLLDITDEDVALKEKRENQRFQLEQLKKRLQQRKERRLQLLKESKEKEYSHQQKRIRVSEEDELLFDSEIHVEAEKEEEPIGVTKIYYCSRTHSQLSQVFQEFVHSAWAQDVQCSCIGGRRSFCIHPTVKRLPTDAQMSDECLFLQRNRSRGKEGCLFHNREREESIRDEVLTTNLDIEDLVQYAEKEKGCPYYASRKAIPYLKLVLLPYNLILNKKSREALGIDLKNQVVIFDEAHNLINAISDLFSPAVSLSMLSSSHSQIDAYYQRYSDRLSSESHSFIIHLQTILKALIHLLTTKPSNFGMVNIFMVNRFIQHLHLESINFFDILHFITSKRIVQKLNGFVDTLGEDGKPPVSHFPAVTDFILALTNDNEDARVVVSYSNESGPFLRFLLLNPSVYFKEIVDECRSVIITGGTLQPFSEFSSQLFPHLSQDRVVSLSLPHILSTDNVGAFYVTQTAARQEMRFDFANRENPSLLSDLVNKLGILCRTVPRGLVVFFPSFAMLQTILRFLHSTQKFSFLNELKPVFSEEREKDVFAAYSSYLKEHPSKGALLFAVIGGKLSEGINFSDDLGRCVAIVGMPYPNKTDVVLQEKMKYLDQQKAGLGQDYYSNLCIKAVNQAIGRAFRHKEDWASVVFLDYRYCQQSIRSRLTRWIDSRGIVCNSDDVLLKQLQAFYQRFNLGV